MKTCIIVPCFNEEKNLPDVISELQTTVPDYSILIVNDCSTDSTAEIKFKNSVQCLHLPINLGVGGAVQTGLKFCMANHFDFAVKFDGDGQHNPADIKTLLEPIVNHQADICVGSRFLLENQGFKSTFFRRIGIRILQFICRLLTGKRITDPTSGFRAYNRRAIEFMSHYYPSFDYPEPEEIVLGLKNDFRIIEVPTQMRKRLKGISTISSALSGYYMLKVTLAMLFISLRSKEEKGKMQLG